MKRIAELSLVELIMRTALVFLALLDAILLFGFLGLFDVPGAGPRYGHGANFLNAIEPIFLLSLVVSTAAFSCSIRWPRVLRPACLVSYAQFPFRYLLLSFSFGFLAPLAGAQPETRGFEFAVYLAMLLEVARLIGTIVLHVGSVEANRIKTKLEILTGRRSRRRVSEVAIQLVAAERTLVTTSTTRTPQESTRESCW